MKKRFQKIILVFVGFIFSLILSEILLTIFNLPPDYRLHTFPSQFQTVNNQEIGYLNLSNAAIEFAYPANPRSYFDINNSVVHHTNNLGFRGNEFNKEKSKDIFRIAILGDSLSFGEGVKDEDTYPQVLEKLLNDKEVQKSFEVLNFAVGGFNTSQELAVLKKYIFDYQPDLIILGYTLNDAEPPLFTIKNGQLIRRNREIKVSENLAFLQPTNSVYRLRFVRLLWQFFNLKKYNQKTIDYYHQLYSENNPSWQKTKDSLKEIQQVCNQKNIPLLAIIFPLFYRLNKYPFFHLHQLISQELKTLEIDFLDLSFYFVGKDERKLIVYPSDQHPNEQVHQKTAEIIFDKIKTIAD